MPGSPDPSRPILFPHLPRTGGFTLKSILETTFGMERTLLDVHFDRDRVRDMTNFAVVEGHRIARFFERTFGADWHANGVTLLRDPVERVVSHARHIRERPQNALHGELLCELQDPKEILERVPHLANLQTKMLAGRLVTATLDASARTEAKATLDRMSFGLTERFNESVTLFAERFGFALPSFGVTNASPSSGDDDLRNEAFRQEARRCNEMDDELYRYATELFEARVSCYRDHLLELPLEQGEMAGELSLARRSAEKSVNLPARATAAELRGWIVVDGAAPDAVLASVGDQTTLVVGRVVNSRAARETANNDNRYAGVKGIIDIPLGAESLTLLAFDRSRRVRAERTIQIHRDPKPVSEPRSTSFGARATRAVKRRLRR